MVDIATDRLLNQIQAQFERDYIALLEPVIERLQARIIALSGNDGEIPLQRLETLQNEAQREILALYAPPYNDENNTQPTSPFSRVLTQQLVAVTVGVAQAHRANMQQLARGEQLFNWLTSEPSGDVYPPFRSVPTFDPFNTWQDQRGFTLSDRIWRTGLQTRNKLGEYLEVNIRQGTSALKMSRDIERFLRPDRAPFRTQMPYGTDASFDAMRLARTEISIAHTRATVDASARNPFVRGVDWKLSPRHPKTDICDSLATIGMGNNRLREPYPVDSAPQVVLSSHPQCICTNLSAVAEGDGLTAIREQLRGAMNENRAPPYVLPAFVRGYVIGLIGTEFISQIDRAIRDNE